MRASWLTATQWVYWACSNNWFVPPFLCTFHRDWVFEMSKPKNTLICPTLKDLERICNQTNLKFLILTHFELNFPSTKNDILWLDIESPSKLFLPLSVSIILPWSTLIFKSVLKSWKKKEWLFLSMTIGSNMKHFTQFLFILNKKRAKWRKCWKK